MQIRLIGLLIALLFASSSNAQSSAKKTDEYGNIKNEYAALRLDNFAIQLQMDPGAMGYIITYRGPQSKASTAQMAADFAKNYLVQTRGMDSSRIVTIDGGLKAEPTTELWTVPYGEQPPIPSPTVKSKSK